MKYLFLEELEEWLITGKTCYFSKYYNLSHHEIRFYFNFSCLFNLWLKLWPETIIVDQKDMFFLGI